MRRGGEHEETSGLGVRRSETCADMSCDAVDVALVGDGVGLRAAAFERLPEACAEGRRVRVAKA